MQAGKTHYCNPERLVLTAYWWENALLGKRVHRPGNPDADHYKQQERPQDVLDPLLWLAPPQKPKRDRNDGGEEQKRLEMGEVKQARIAHAFLPRAASKACRAASKFSTPAVARNLVP